MDVGLVALKNVALQDFRLEDGANVSFAHLARAKSVCSAFQGTVHSCTLIQPPQIRTHPIIIFTCILSKLSGKFYILVQALYLQSIPLYVAG